MKFRYGVLMAALAASLFGVPSFAASLSSSSSNAAGTATSNNAGIGNSNAGSSSGAYSGATANGGNGGEAIGTGGNGGYAGSNVTFTYNDPAPAAGDPSSTQTERLITTGTAIAPSIYNNNACGLAASAAAGFMGGAFALGFDRIDKGCDRRAFASLLGHFAEINSIAAAHAPDAQVRALAERNAEIYSQWANNYLCMQDPDLAEAAPPGSNVCRTIATQTGLQVVPAPVASYATNPPVYAKTPPNYATAAIDPPPKPAYTGPHNYGPHEGAVPSSWHTGPVSGYNGPDYSDE